jgi:O-antigen ligase
MNIYELFNPLAFSSVLGRSAGFYINPNQCGAALVLGMILSIGLLPQRYRLLFGLIVGLAVFLTFSRAAIIGWFIVISLMIKFGEISLKRSLMVGSTIVALIAVITLSEWNTLQYKLEGLGVLNTNVLARVGWLNNFASDDYSSLERKQIAELAWGMFADRPIFGSGVAASLTWSFEKSSHNQYLNMMVDHGILGMFFLPLLVLAICWRATADVKPTAIALGTFISWWGFFSHNIFSERYILLSFALLSAMVMTSRLTHKASIKSASLDMSGAHIITNSRLGDRVMVPGYQRHRA